MKTRYFLCAVAAVTLAACSKSDTKPVDSALAINPSTAIPLDSVSAAEQARAASLAAPAAVAPAPTKTKVVYRDRPVYRSSGSSSSGSSTSGTTTTSSNAGTHIEKNTKRDAAIGAAAGAVIGAATGGGVKGAVVGGAAGAILGGVIGNNVDKKRKKN
jgi:outer membrane lipoprotein SlyB